MSFPVNELSSLNDWIVSGFMLNIQIYPVLKNSGTLRKRLAMAMFAGMKEKRPATREAISDFTTELRICGKDSRMILFKAILMEKIIEKRITTVIFGRIKKLKNRRHNGNQNS